jgi:hypothetical protein
MHRFWSGVLSVAAIAACAPQAAAQPTVQIGVLECRGNTPQYVVGSTTDMTCILRRPGGGMAEPYGGTLHREGFDIGPSHDVVASWTVLAPSPRFYAGDLAGTYALQRGGLFGSGSEGLLVGGNNSAFALRPLPLRGQVGIAIAGEAIGLVLRAGR